MGLVKRVVIGSSGSSCSKRQAGAAGAGRRGGQGMVGQEMLASCACPPPQVLHRQQPLGVSTPHPQRSTTLPLPTPTLSSTAWLKGMPGFCVMYWSAPGMEGAIRAAAAGHAASVKVGRQWGADYVAASTAPPPPPPSAAPPLPPPPPPPKCERSSRKGPLLRCGGSSVTCFRIDSVWGQASGASMSAPPCNAAQHSEIVCGVGEGGRGWAR